MKEEDVDERERGMDDLLQGLLEKASQSRIKKREKNILEILSHKI